MATQHFIIYHGIDADGWMSAAICELYMNSLQKEFEYYPYNYGWNIHNLEEKLDNLKNQDLDFIIFMVDCTLPDEFMMKYAQHIYLIDHHKSSIENIEKIGLKNKLFKFASKITVEGYLDTNCNQAAQISAAELTWLELFPEKPMPKAIRLIGRYDVWDHDESNSTHDLNMFIRINSVKPENKFAIQNEPWFKLMITDETLLNQYIKEGALARTYKTIFNEQDAIASTKYLKTKNGDIIAIANRGNINSTFFDAISKKFDIDACISYVHNLNDNSFRISMYSLKQHFNALKHLKNVIDTLSPDDVVSHGGHVKACGALLTNNGFKKFISNHLIIKYPNK